MPHSVDTRLSAKTGWEVSMIGKTTKGWKHQHIFSDITSKDYVNTEEGCRTQKQLVGVCHKPAIQQERCIY